MVGVAVRIRSTCQVQSASFLPHRGGQTPIEGCHHRHQGRSHRIPVQRGTAETSPVDVHPHVGGSLGVGARAHGVLAVVDDDQLQAAMSLPGIDEGGYGAFALAVTGI